WPNDILLNGRKTAGILTEMAAELDRVKHITLGIGVDVNLNSSDFPPDLRKLVTSLKIELDKPVFRSELAVEILPELDRDYNRVCSGQFPVVAEEWGEHCATIGAIVSIQTGNRHVRGRAESLAEDGALLVRTEHGHLERIVGGDVILEK